MTHTTKMAQRIKNQARITEAYNFNDHARRMASCNHLYMGSMATCILIGKLGGHWPTVGVKDALDTATDAQLVDGVEYCANILKCVDAEKAKS